MGIVILTFGNIEIEKNKFYRNNTYDVEKTICRY